MAKIYRWVYQYTRHNPQTGVHTRTAEVYETTLKKAEKVARRHCDDTLYGSDYFDRIIQKSEPIVLGVDVEERVKYVGEWPREKRVTEYSQLYPKAHSEGWYNLKEV